MAQSFLKKDEPKDLAMIPFLFQKGIKRLLLNWVMKLKIKLGTAQ